LDSEPDILKVVFGTIIANRLDTLPVWTMIISESSSGKTEILSSLSKSGEVHVLSILTPNALISGLNKEETKDKKEPSLLPLIDGKVVLIKDASVLTSLHPNFRGFIFSQLRAAYDGELEKHTGMGSKSFKSKFGMLIGATRAVESLRTLEHALGERFIYFRPGIEHCDAAWAKVKASGSEHSKMKRAISNAALEFLNICGTPKEILFPDEVRELAEAIPALRTEALKDGYTKEVVSPIVVEELPYRVGKQLAAIYTAVCLLTEGDTKTAFRIVRRIAKHTIPYTRLRILELILRGHNTQKEISEILGVAQSKISAHINELYHLNVIDKSMFTTKGQILTVRDNYISIFKVTPLLKR